MHRAVDGHPVTDVHVAIRLYIVYGQINGRPGRAQGNDVDGRAARPGEGRDFAPIGLVGRLTVCDQDNAGQVCIDTRGIDLFQCAGDIRFLPARLFRDDLFGKRTRIFERCNILLLGQRAGELEDAQFMLRQQVGQQTGRRLGRTED